MNNVVFEFNQTKMIIQCLNTDKMYNICSKFAKKTEKDIDNLFFIYGGIIIDLESSFEEYANNKNEIKVLAYEKDNQDIKMKLKKSKDIICPKCNEICLISFKDNKFNLFGCKNGHETNYKSLNEFNNTQNINEYFIKCDDCLKNNKSESHNNKFYLCLTCNKNICPLCQLKHDKKHKIIDYEFKNYKCQDNNSFNSYCIECKKNLCVYCISKHNKKHTIIKFEKILSEIKGIKEDLNIFKKKIDKVKYNINEIKKRLDKVSEYMDLYYNINSEIISNFRIENTNYEILQNLITIKNNINQSSDIDGIINENNYNNKFKSLLDIYALIENKPSNNDNNNSNNNPSIDINELNDEITLKYNINHK